MNSFYRIPEKRYAILKRFCETYPRLVLEYKNANPYGKTAGVKQFRSDRSTVSDPTHCTGIRLYDISRKIDLIEMTARETSDIYWKQILVNVTEDRSFDYLKYELKMDCSRQKFFELRLKYFWLLNRKFFPAETVKLHTIEKMAA